MDNRAFNCGVRIWLSTHLKKCIADSGLSVHDFAKKCGISSHQIDAMMSGKLMPTLDVFLKIIYSTGNVFYVSHSDIPFYVRHKKQVCKPSKLSSITINFK